MSCPCDNKAHPKGLAIPPGLTVISRQIAGFPEFRGAMIADIASRPALAGWRPGGQADLGLMLIEMWAYVADALAFQDEVHAHECYLRTARQRSSVRRLVELLGYLPRPAVGATVELALLGEGRRAISVPRGTAFRSGAFGAEAPQVFELDQATIIHPLLNRWTLEPSRAVVAGDPGGPGANPTRLLLDPRTARLIPGDIVLVTSTSGQIEDQARRVADVSAIVAADGTRLVAVDFEAALVLPASTVLAQLRLSKATQTAAPWTLTQNQAVSVSGSTVYLALDGIHRQIKAGQRVMYQYSGGIGDFDPISEVTEVTRTIDTGTFDGNATTAQIPVTRLAWDSGSAFGAVFFALGLYVSIPTLVLHHGLVEGGRVGVPAPTVLAPPPAGGALVLGGAVEIPAAPVDPHVFQLRDRNLRGVEIEGSVDLEQRKLKPATGTSWSPPLALPVEAFGNVVQASRGETVTGEVLGSGDASLAHQSFKLKKAPLTYLVAPGGGSASGVAAALEVLVSGVRWKEVPSFYGAGPMARVYVVRQNDAGESTLTFGDGVRGARLPTGARNVVASYRFGAGGATPPAGSIEQIGRVIKGLAGVKNPVAAGGGADAETAESMRSYAPRKALLLGRAVSLLDMEAVAAGMPGVVAVRAEWVWSGTMQRPVAQIAFIGTPAPGKVREQIESMTDPSAVVTVVAATPVPVDLALSIDVDTAQYHADDVAAAVARELLTEPTGLLSLASIGIGLPFYRSRLSEAVLRLPGVLGASALWNGAPMSDFAVSPGAGAYFDVGGSISINGKEHQSGD